MRAAIAIVAAILAIAIVAWKLCLIVKPTAIPALPKQWHDQVYGLDDDEVIRLIAPPFPLQRASGFLPAGQFTGQTMHLVRTDGQVQPIGWTSKTGTVRSALAHCVNIPQAELRVQPHAGSVVVDGDWIVREQIRDERRMQALALILDSATARKIQVTENAIYAYCVVVQGNWNPPGKTGDPPEPLRFDPRAPEAAPEVMRGAPKDFLRFLEQNFRCRFFDETVDPLQIVSWLNDMPAGLLGSFERRAIFRTLESQTSLQFIETRRPIQIWNVRERPSTTQPTKK